MTMTRLLRLAPLLLACLAQLAAATDLAPNDWLHLSERLSGGRSVDFTPHGTQPGLVYPLQSSDDCSACHGADSTSPTDPTLKYRPHAAWAGSMMANAMRDPLFLAALDVANHDVPGVGDFCLRCHTSNGWYAGHVVKQGFGLPANDVTLGAAACLLEGSYDAPDGYSDYSGLSCHFCHRNMAQGSGGAPMPGNGAAWLDDSDCGGAGEPCRRGPYTYTGVTPPHPWQYSPLHTQSAMCGQCHDVTSPDTGSGPLKTLKLADGTDTGVPFPIERTFSEWQRSSYAGGGQAQTCQGCHMPMSEDPNASACGNPGYPNRSGTLAVHAFAGGNTWIPAVLKGEYDDTEGIPGSWNGLQRGNSFDQTVEWARQMLQSAATLQATITSLVAPGSGSPGSIGLQVKVTNRSGHKFPSGYSEGRRAWLNVRVHDRYGNLLVESAAYDGATAVLTRDAQARVYEVLQGIWNYKGGGNCDTTDLGNQPMFHFALSDCIAKDNRIPPLGFTPATAADPQGYEVRPVAASYPETTPGSGVLVNHDLVSYSFVLPAGAMGPFTVQARLYYQTSSRDYIEFLRREAQVNAFEGENQMCADGPGRPYVVGPKDRTRGEYLYQLWNNAANDAQQPGYGKSPPEAIAFDSAISDNDRIFRDGFDGGA